MKRYAIAYVVMLVAFPVIDIAWIGGLASGFYKAQIGQLLLGVPRLAPAVVFYALYAAGVLVFVVAPGLERDWRRTLVLGAFFGLVAYGVYDLTNLSTLKGFTVKIVAADMAWGVVLTSTVASLGRLAALRFG
jgi:uncharacterized membrane protein